MDRQLAAILAAMCRSTAIIPSATIGCAQDRRGDLGAPRATHSHNALSDARIPSSQEPLGVAETGLRVATVTWGQLRPLKRNSTRCVYCICSNSEPSSSLTCSIQNVVLTTVASALELPFGVLSPASDAILAVPPPASGIEPGDLVSDVRLKIVVLRTVCLARASNKKRFGFLR